MDGRIIQKISLTDSSNHIAFMNFINRFGRKFQNESIAKNEAIDRGNEQSDGVDVNVLRRDWVGMNEAADLDFLLQRHGLSRLLSFKLIGKIWAAPVSLEIFNSLIAIMAQLGLSCSYGVDTGIGLHTYLAKVERFSLNFRKLELVGGGVKYCVDEDGIGSIWVVNIPRGEGLTVLELFDRNGGRVGQIKSDNDSNTQKVWQDIVGTFPITA